MKMPRNGARSSIIVTLYFVHGAVAQLIERRIRIAEVVGLNPISSTNLRRRLPTVARRRRAEAGCFGNIL